MKKLIVSAIALGIVAPLSAQWNLVGNFNDGTAAGWTVTITGPTLAKTPGTATVVDAPAALAAQGKVLRLYPGETAGGAAALTYNYTFAFPESQKNQGQVPRDGQYLDALLQDAVAPRRWRPGHPEHDVRLGLGRGTRHHSERLVVG